MGTKETAGIAARVDEEPLFELAKDVLMTSVMNLKPNVRLQLTCENTDFIITRPQGRARSLIIEQEVADFLETFKRPISIQNAVHQFSQQQNKDVVAFREAIGETIKRMRLAGFLVEAGTKSSTDFTLSEGQFIGSVHITSGIKIQDETEIYQCNDKAGRLRALKIAKTPADEKIIPMMEREYTILSLAPHPLTPNAVEIGNYQGRQYLVMDWCEGYDVLWVANQIRQMNTHAYPFAQLKALVVDVLRAYEKLHSAEIIHGDIHPKNCIVDQQGSIHIIDFGLSIYTPTISTNAPVERLGVPYFYDPAFAAAVLEKKTPSAATFSSDLYSLGALAYLLLTGYHYLSFRLDRRHFFQQIKGEPMRSFNQVGIPGWPAVETILAKALSKNEQDRFSSAKAFADALASEEFSLEKGSHFSYEAEAKIARAAIGRLQRGGLDYDAPLSPPTMSLHFGAAGIAYTMLTCSQKNSHVDLLSDADIWSTRAKYSRDPHAYVYEDAGISEKVATPNSLHYGRLGVCVSEVLVAIARWDCLTVNRGIREICDLVASTLEDFDLMSGKAGGLLGCALVLEAIPDDPLIPSKQLLIKTGRAIAEYLLTELEKVGPISTNKTIRQYGMAHGWAGVLYSLLRWAEIDQKMPDEIVKHYLLEMATLSIPMDVGRRWPIQTSDCTNSVDPTDHFSASWCKGSSGFVHLFALGFETFGEPVFLDMAIAAADYGFSASPNGASLCCGDAGVAYAQLVLFRLTGEQLFLDRAKTLTTRAMKSQLPGSSSLYKGKLGLHLLIQELAFPQTARMPFFERSGWPVMLNH